ncbi:hypothetical protein LTR64_002038 [Lithohypha guttulata]|uniref:Paf1-domain-containing protein n=1 Tax=Lithohypha guttulata TaxID=1690604 RepID=A0AAN7STZ7_9EURO|nr:hypothetical protein LTR51_007897 [Lithohypha guttulata]KAK5081526.1 hypothetical protein LTR05_007657 [Lithohypha guttulata]
MASKESYKQDLVISIRYRNDLPPPPMPPKLLEIDTGGLQQYLDPGFAASIAKREEPNIEADAEGGMPIDVIGMYGYFEGDESSIMAPEVPPILHPDDELLMLGPEQLKAGGPVSGTNFLRKTQYLTATAAVANDPSRMVQSRARKDARPKQQVLPRNDKENVKRNIQKAFDLAYPHSKQQDSTSYPVSQAELGFYPLLPDFDANTAIRSSWNLLRFDKPPLPAIRGHHRDNRIDAAFLMATEHPESMKVWEEQKKAYDQDPKNFDNPGNPPAAWSLLLPRDQAATPLIRTIMNQRHPEHDYEGHMARVAEPDERDDDRLKIPFDLARFYSNALSKDNDPGRHTRQVVVTLPKSSNKSRAHYYPIGQVNKLMGDRANLGSSLKSSMVQDLPDQVMIAPRELSNIELEYRASDREDFDPAFASTYAEIEAAARREKEEQPPDVATNENLDENSLAPNVDAVVEAATERQAEDTAAGRGEDVRMEDARLDGDDEP